MSKPKKLMTADDLEALALTRIPAEMRREEPDLMLTKWFDYRLLHPVTATNYYAGCYQTAVRNAYAQTKDRDSASSIVVVGDQNILLDREGTSYWRARQACDQVGCRYEFALRWAMTRMGERGWHVFPRPNQLYSIELVLDLADAWKIECAASLQFPISKFFKIDHYVGHPDQDAYQAWLIEQIKSRTNEHWRPLSRAFSEKVLDHELAVKAFGLESVKKARAVAGI